MEGARKDGGWEEGSKGREGASERVREGASKGGSDDAMQGESVSGGREG